MGRRWNTRKIQKDTRKEANVAIIGIILTLLLVMVIIFVFYTTSSDPNWETPWNDNTIPFGEDDTSYEDYDTAPIGKIDGTWGTEIIVKYEDGSTESLKPAFDKIGTLSIWHNDKKVTGIRYILKGKAEGTGHNNVDVNIENYELTWKLTRGNSIVNDFTIKASGSSTSDWGSYIKTIPLDGEWKIIWSETISIEKLAPDSLPVGSYTVSVIPGGILECKKRGERATGKLPGMITFNIEIQEDDEEKQQDEKKWIRIDLESGVDAHEGESGGITVKTPLKCWRCNPDGTVEYAYYPSEYHTVCPPGHPIGPQENPPECGDPTKPDETLSYPLKIYGHNENNDYYIHIPQESDRYTSDLFDHSIIANSLTVEFIGFKWAAVIYDIIDWKIYTVHNGKKTLIGEGTHPYWTTASTTGYIDDIYPGFFGVLEKTVLVDPASFTKQPIDGIIIKLDSILSNVIPTAFRGTLDMV